jgi:hypothetical protein
MKCRAAAAGSERPQSKLCFMMRLSHSCQVQKWAMKTEGVETRMCLDKPTLLARRSKLEVARHLGLSAPKPERRPQPPNSPVNVHIPEEEVAAMLMALPHGPTHAGRCAWLLFAPIIACGMLGSEECEIYGLCSCCTTLRTGWCTQPLCEHAASALQHAHLETCLPCLVQLLHAAALHALFCDLEQAG